MLPCRARGAASLIPAAAILIAALAAWPERPTVAAESDEHAVTGTEEAARVEFFERKVRPLLAARCHKCHSDKEQKGNLRLDSRAAVLKGGDTAPAVVPGAPDESLLVDAIRYGDTYQMPPKTQLPPDEIAILVEWVRQGVPWGAEQAAAGGTGEDGFDIEARSGHWCFQPLAKTNPPEVAGASWVETPVDRFILAKLEGAGMRPAPAADRRTWLRRVTFDLTGLPPTPSEIEAFLADQSAAAWKTVVDRLLASPRYGEHWARHWLDLVRYAETYGHEFDFDIPNAFRYRDYVIRALNADLPFDQFVMEHVAGDLLPAPRRHPRDGYNESIIGTGWFFFGEAKHSPVDVRGDEADRVDNQIDVFSKALLGLTVSCARCHDHKFDAISTEDYYALAGYLQSSRYQQAFIDSPDARSGELARLGRLRESGRRLCAEFARAEMLPRLKQFSQVLLAGGAGPGEKVLGRMDHVLHPWAVLAEDGRPAEDFAARRVELLARLKTQQAAAGERTVFADFASLKFDVWRPTGDAFGTCPAGPFAWSCAGPGGRFPGSLLTDAAAHSGLISPRLQGALRSPTFEITTPRIWYRVYGKGAKVRLIVDGLQLIRNPIYGGLEFDPGGPEARWHAQDVSKWIGHQAYIELVDDGDGYVALEKVVFSDAGPPADAPNGIVIEMLDDDSLTSPEALAAKYQSTFERVLADWLETPDSQDARAADRAAVVGWILEQQLLDPQGLKSAEPDWQSSWAALEREQREIEAALVPPNRAVALADGTAENERVFIRGNHKTPGAEVPRRFLEVLGGAEYQPTAQGSGRLELARQLVSPDNPLVPRVIVNRLWHHHFGAGIVRTPDDFGAMGQPPTHPELLDYLARELVRNGWSLKHLHRLMVLSGTYRMSSRPRAEADRADPENKLWHRMQVRRLQVESIRDAILLVSSRADLSMYGPGVMPHLTEFMVGRGRPKQSGPLDGDGRRSIYQAVRRNFLSPMFLAFDYPTPFTTIGRRGASNVPAQALAMMNNPFVVEQARYWAERVLRDAGQSRADKVRSMYLAALAREPDEAELADALDFVESAAAETSRRQAWADFAHVLFNVKEFIFIP